MLGFRGKIRFGKFIGPWLGDWPGERCRAATLANINRVEASCRSCSSSLSLFIWVSGKKDVSLVFYPPKIEHCGHVHIVYYTSIVEYEYSWKTTTTFWVRVVCYWKFGEFSAFLGQFLFFGKSKFGH